MLIQKLLLFSGLVLISVLVFSILSVFSVFLILVMWKGRAVKILPEDIRENENKLAASTHVSLLIAPVLSPLVLALYPIYLWKDKEQSEFVRKHAQQAMNFYSRYVFFYITGILFLFLTNFGGLLEFKYYYLTTIPAIIIISIQLILFLWNIKAARAALRGEAYDYRLMGGSSS
ncbi:MAG: DUF4870 domain-containing protein [Candidatus Altiarchaeales archaeon]|nr:DUF4870 domain-containing protein [Candidatus Altiarchaeales archaeon]